jgi:hypothetical protein
MPAFEQSLRLEMLCVNAELAAVGGIAALRRNLVHQIREFGTRAHVLRVLFFLADCGLLALEGVGRLPGLVLVVQGLQVAGGGADAGEFEVAGAVLRHEQLRILALRGEVALLELRLVVLDLELEFLEVGLLLLDGALLLHDLDLVEHGVVGLDALVLNVVHVVHELVRAVDYLVVGAQAVPRVRVLVHLLQVDVVQPELVLARLPLLVVVAPARGALRSRRVLT